MKKSEQKSTLYPSEAGFEPRKATTVGGVVLAKEDIEYNVGRTSTRISIRNTGDRPIQVGSHFHLFEVNRFLEFDREVAFGCHLNIPATTAIRFEPGDSREVEIVPFAGKRRVVGFNGLTEGYAGEEDSPAYYPVRERALRRVANEGFKSAKVQATKSSVKSKTKTDDDGNNIKTGV